MSGAGNMAVIMFVGSGLGGYQSSLTKCALITAGVVGAAWAVYKLLQQPQPIKWAEKVGVGYMKALRGHRGTSEFLDRTFPDDSDRLQRTARVAKVNQVVTALVLQAKLKYGNMTPKPENGFIIRDFMNATVVAWRRKALDEHQRDRVRGIRAALPDAPANDEGQPHLPERDDDGRDHTEQDEYDEMFMVWELLRTTRKHDLVSIASKATALYFVLTPDEEDVHHVLNSKVIRAQYSGPQ